ncbi:hypothetical protein [Sporosarcina sp. FSL W7-1283]|uniref:hypothetical protein n=1 Tax=Sporosarcina sp. FSL W7-1283 TaxID=2921560 RepID=UPI0030F54801
MKKEIIKQAIKEMFLNDELEICVRLSNIYTNGISVTTDVIIDGEIVGGSFEEVYLDNIK